MAVDNSLVEKSMRSVFVGNIPYDMTDERLKEIFSQVGPVLSFRMMTDRSTGKPKGYGFCEFRDPETALSAMRNLNGFEIGGRSLRVDNACTEKSRMEMQTLMQGPAHDSPYGDEVEPTEAPEAITKAVASLPPEQMFELMKQMKMCIQNNPTEARTMLLQNPQLAYALLQAQVVMRIVDPQAAAAMLHKSQPGPTVLQPSEEPPAGGRPELAAAGPLPVSVPPSVPPSAQQQPAPVSAPPLRDGRFGSLPGQDVDFRRGGVGPMGGDMDLRNMDHRGMAPRQVDQDHRGMAPRQGDQDHRGIAPRQGDQDHRSMAPRQGDQDHRGIAPRLGDQDHRSMAPKQGDQDLRMPPRDVRRAVGPSSGSRVDVDLRAADRDMRGPPPQDYDARSYGRDMRAPMGGYGGAPRGFGGAGMDGMGGGGGPPSSRGDMRDPRMPSLSQDRDMRGGGRGAAAAPSSGAPSVSDIDVGLSASLAGGDQEKAALIMQVLQLSDEQVAMLPAEQRQSITLLKQQISAAKQKGSR